MLKLVKHISYRFVP